MYIDGRVRQYESVRWRTTSCYEFHIVSACRSEDEMLDGRTNPISKSLDSKKDISQRRMMRKDLDLARAIEENVVL